MRSRQFVRFFSNYAAAGNSAFTTFWDITLLGHFEDAASVFLHETGHNLDLWVGGEGKEPHSFTQEWRDVVARDSCVPDYYALSSYTEDYAQVAVMAAFDVNIGSIWQYKIGCMANQMGRGLEQLWSVLHNDDRKCNRRLSQA